MSGSTKGPGRDRIDTAIKPATVHGKEGAPPPRGPSRGATSIPSGSVTGPTLAARPPVAVRSPIVVRAPEDAHDVAAAPAALGGSGHRHDACERLHDRVLGEVVLRHTTGERVLDLGRGVPQITTWVSERAASLQVVDAVDLGRGGSIRLPYANGVFSVVVCLRTLPHLGRDPETSSAAAQSALAEVARVLAPGGTALVEIDNPLSLWGALHGLRRPARALEPGPMCIDSARGLTRFDTLKVMADRLPTDLVVTDLHAMRTVAVLPSLLAIPVLGRIFESLEWWARDRPIVRRAGGHLLVVLRLATS